MPRLAPVCISHSYSVEIPDLEVFSRMEQDDALDEEMMLAGAYRVEANGHYGSAYFFSLDAKDDPSRIVEILERYMSKHAS